MTVPASPGEAAPTPGSRFIHADAVVIGEKGVLIRGPSGAGKSRLALALIDVAERAGAFARLVGDDRIRLDPRGGRLVARGHPAIRGAIERRGQGIFETSFLEAAVLGLVVDLVATASEAPRFPENGATEVLIEGVTLPVLTLPPGLGPLDQATAVLQHLRLRRIVPESTLPAGRPG